MLPLVRRLGPWLVAPLIGLSNCTLIDQTTFNPKLVSHSTQVKPPMAPPPNGALLTISLADYQPDYQGALAEAIRQALAIKPDATFRVISMVPQTGVALPSWDDAEKITVWGRRVADQIERDGVDPGQVSLGLQVSPGLDHGEIRVYVQ